MQEDWRLTNQMKYLQRSKLLKSTYAKQNSHDHCEFCFDKFGTDSGLLNTGYCTLDKYRWVCENCFNDFYKLFEWDVEEEN